VLPPFLAFLFTVVVFSKNGKLAAVAERKDSKDWVNIVDCHTWNIVKVLMFSNLSFSSLVTFFFFCALSAIQSGDT